MLKSVSILICFLFSISSWAGPSSSLEDYEIQRTIQELCSYQDSIVFAGHFFNKAVESMRSEVEFTFTSWTARFIKSRGETVFQSRYMHDFIGSDAFIREMRSCYPHEGQRNRLVFLTLWADIDRKSVV